MKPLAVGWRSCAVAVVILVSIPVSGTIGGSIATAVPFLANGGRVAWYKGSAPHSLIAFDAVVDPTTLNSEVYTINPDYTSPQCVTCDSGIRKGFVGQPAWHPDGDRLVIQVENDNSPHTVYNHMAWGFDNDLWIINRDGTGAERIWTTPPGYASLHPQFSRDGTKLAFAERVPTGAVPENPWDGWRIRVADVDLSQGTVRLNNVATLTPSGTGLYETHEFTADGRIVYSHTDGGRPYVDDIYVANADGSGPVNLLNRPTSWDEHGHFSPFNQTLAFMSSRFDPASGTVLTLRTDLYVIPPGGVPLRVTYHNRTSTDRYVVKDFDWDRSGTRIVYLLWGPDLKSPQIWILTFS